MKTFSNIKNVSNHSEKGTGTKENPKRGFFDFLEKHPIFEAALIAIFLNLIMEIISRRSFLSAFEFTFCRPLFFLSGAAVLFLTLSIAPFFRKKVFAYSLISIVWLCMAITNAALVVIRTAPFEAVDFSIIRTGLGIITIYLKIWQIILISLALLFVIGGVVFLGIRMKSNKVYFKKAFISLLISALVCLSIVLPLNLFGFYPYAFSNLSVSYDTYGFTYCFTASIFDRGVNRPSGYSEKKVDGLTEEINDSVPERVESTPNIIYLQLESFFDVSRLATVEFSENPIPFFTELKANYSSGLLTVPSIGAGTANTEFEIVTGMSHNDFGTGEYPYKSFLQRKSCESTAYI